MNPAGRFGGRSEPLRVIFPSRFEAVPKRDAHQLRGLRQLFHAHRAPLESELGAPLSLEQAPHELLGPTWLIGPSQCTPELARLNLPASSVPMVHRLPDQQILITDAPDANGLFESLSLLRSFAWAPGDSLEARPCASSEEAFLHAGEVIAHTWPSFQRRAICWRDLCVQYANAAAVSLEPLDALQIMVAQLDDAHTAVRRTDTIVPTSFRACIAEDGIVLHEVPKHSAAWLAGAREGHRLLHVDLGRAWQRIGATPHHRPFAVPFRALSGELGKSTSFAAAAPNGDISQWTELYQLPDPDSLVAWRMLPSGAGYLRIKQWPSSDRIDELIDAAFADVFNAPGLIVDLRGNPGGAGSVAARFRDRFLRERTRLGTVRFTRPDGALLPPEELWAEPAAPQKRWNAAVRFITDPGTYSASEDALLGLQGLQHVEVLGEPSGGGSGRARSIRLLPGWRLTVSSCLTFDRLDRCIEGSGIPLDRAIPMAGRTHNAWEAELLAAADRGW
jgi:carboxyl-terminal processing protease